jgi:hypothetical protein
MSRFLLGVRKDDPATSADLATSVPKPPENRRISGSSPGEGACYLAPRRDRSSSEVAGVLLPKNPTGSAASATEVATVAEVASTAPRAGRRRPDRLCANPPAPTSLIARLTAAGATVRTWGGGDNSLVEVPECLSDGLLREVGARGWRVIRGGKPNAEAEHDSWAFGGVGIRGLD